MSPRSAILALAVTWVACASAGCSSESAPRFIDGDAAAAPDAVSASCSTSAQCDDGVACTTDICVVGGTCTHVPDSPSCVVPQRCARTADCNDNIACTRDSCLVDGTCSHTAQNDMCSAGQTCDLTRGCSSGTTPGTCRTDVDCRDTFDCTVDTCGADGRCTYTAQNSRCMTGQVCRVGMGCISERTCSSDADCDDMRRCNGVERCVEFGCVAGTAANCDDMDACTVDACNETGAMCTHATNPSCMGTAGRTGRYNIAPAVSMMCHIAGVPMPVLNFSFDAVQMMISSAGVSITGARVPLSGPPIVGGMFRATGSEEGTCREDYTLEGRFTDDRHFEGFFSLNLVDLLGGLGCLGVTCGTTRVPVSGTLAM